MAADTFIGIRMKVLLSYWGNSVFKGVEPVEVKGHRKPKYGYINTDINEQT